MCSGVPLLSVWPCTSTRLISGCRMTVSAISVRSPNDSGRITALSSANWICCLIVISFAVTTTFGLLRLRPQHQVDRALLARLHVRRHDEDEVAVGLDAQLGRARRDALEAEAARRRRCSGARSLCCASVSTTWTPLSGWLVSASRTWPTTVPTRGSASSGQSMVTSPPSVGTVASQRARLVAVGLDVVRVGAGRHLVAELAVGAGRERRQLGVVAVGRDGAGDRVVLVLLVHEARRRGRAARPSRRPSHHLVLTTGGRS